MVLGLAKIKADTWSCKSVFVRSNLQKNKKMRVRSNYFKSGIIFDYKWRLLIHRICFFLQS